MIDEADRDGDGEVFRVGFRVEGLNEALNSRWWFPFSFPVVSASSG